MQGIFIAGRRPKSKKEVKEAIVANPDMVDLEATSMFGDEYEGPVSLFTGTATFVGPDPYTKRNFYGTIKVANGKITVS